MALGREERIKIYGSPPFKQKPSVNAGEHFTWSVKGSHNASKYKPFDHVVLQNDSSEDVELRLNGDSDREFFVSAGTSRILDNINSFVTYWVKNVGSGAIASGELTIEVKRKGMDSDKRARQEALATPFENIFKKFTGLNL